MDSGRIIEVPHDEFKDPFAGMTIAEIKAADEPDTGTLTDASLDKDRTMLTVGFEGTVGFGNACGISANRCPGNVLPDWVIELAEDDELVGKSITFYQHINSIHGVDIDGREVFYLTPLERDAERVNWLADYDRRKREDYARNKKAWEADFQKLPPPLKARIQFFRDRDPAFQVEDQGYELFCCVEAAKFLERAKDAAKHGANRQGVEKFFAKPERAKGDKVWDVPLPDDPAEAWLLWAWAVGSSDEFDYDNKKQKKLLDYDEGHSGNTFGGAVRLAIGCLRGETLHPEPEPEPVA